MYSHISMNFLNYSQKLSLYAGIAGDYLNMEAIFSDETSRFLSPCSPSFVEPVTFKIRTGSNNVDRVFLCGGGAVNEAVEAEAEKCGPLKREMLKASPQAQGGDGLFDIYSVTLEKVENTFHYYFLIEKNNRAYYYNKRGLAADLDESYNFVVIPGFYAPDWAKGAVMYQIFVDRFYNGDTSNDVKQNEYAYLGRAAKFVDNWTQTPSNLDVANFYGGDLRGVIEKIPYLKDLGVEVIYFCPIFVSPSNHKYDAQDYEHVDPHYGVIEEDGGSPLYFETFHNRYATMYMQRTTKPANLAASDRLLCELIDLAHENGIRVVLDGVFNHCGAFNKWMDRENFYSGKGYANGAYLDKYSPYHDYFRWYDENWPNNDCYDAWWGLDNHPKLNYEASRELYRTMLDVGRKWVSAPFHADGWRLDVAADLGYSKAFNHQFWRDFRKAVREANPEAIILAEHYDDPGDWLAGDQWDTVMNYGAFMEPITWFLTGMEKHSDTFCADMLSNAAAFESAMRYHMARFPLPSLHTAMNQLSNHDHSRFLTRTNMRAGRLNTHGAEAADEGINRAIMMEAITFQMTWPGAPALYYGDEAGVAGWTDPDSRRTYPWGREDQLLLGFYKAAIAIHKKYSALKTGSLEFLTLDHGILTYARWNGENRLVVALNNNTSERRVAIPVWKAEIGVNATLRRILHSTNDAYSTEEKAFTASGGFLDVTLPALGSAVFVEE